MRETIARKLRKNPQLVAFLVAVFALGVSNGVFQTTFNNYLNDVFHIGATTRGALEFPRELPGFLVALLSGALFFLVENRVAALAASFTGLGMVGLGLIGPQWGLMLAFMITWSIGQHVEMPMRSAIAMSLGTERQHGRRLGQTQAARVGATIVGGAAVWLVIETMGHNYLVTFVFGGVAAILGALFYFRLKPTERHTRREKLVVKRKYTLYYVLCTLFGARKQVFLTFAPWVLVKVYGQPASTFAKLWIASAVIGVFFQQGLGELIDRWGERRVLMADGAMLVLICLGYAFANRVGLPEGRPIWVLFACYVLDQLLFGVENARSAYLAKIADRPEDVSPSLSMGITLNHAVSMVVPYFGGKYIWDLFGYEWVFVAAAGLSVLTIVAASQARTPPRREEVEHGPAPTDDIPAGG
ncbi:MAG: MFS transporter [Armatimonadota bacterium]|nr:MFS transporter [Armatimonadota bacterium]